LELVGRQAFRQRVEQRVLITLLQCVECLPQSLAIFFEKRPLFAAHRPLAHGCSVIHAGEILFDRVMREVPPTDAASAELFREISSNWCLEDRLVSRDGKSIAIYIPIARKDMSRRIGEQIEAILHEQLLPGQRYHFAGLPIAEDTFGFEMFLQMGVVAPLAFMFIMLLVYLMFRQMIFLIPIAMDAMFAVIWAMGLLIATGHTVHIMSSMIPVFLMPIAILDDCHVLSEFFDRYRALQDKRHALTEAYHALYRPMLQTSLTSAVGFGSLALTDIPPVRVFGVFVAFGIMAAWLFSMTVVPAVISLMRDERLQKIQVFSSDGKASLLDRVLQPLGRFAFGHSRLVLLAALALIAISIAGLMKVEVNDNPVNWFKESHPLRRADTFMNEHFGGTYTAYLVANGREPGTFKRPEVLRYLEQMQEHLKGEKVVGLSTGIPDPPALPATALDQPRRRQLVAAVDRIERDIGVVAAQTIGHGRGDHRVLEKAAGIAQPGGIGELVATDLADDIADQPGRDLTTPPRRHPLHQLTVTQHPLGLLRQRHRNRADEMAPGRLTLEPAVAIAEMAGIPIHRRRLSTVEIDPLQRGKALRQLQAVGADVLYRRGAHRSGDQREIFQPRIPHRDGGADETMPRLSGPGTDQHMVGGLVDEVDASGVEPDHDPRPVVDEQEIGATAEQQPRQAIQRR